MLEYLLYKFFKYIRLEHFEDLLKIQLWREVVYMRGIGHRNPLVVNSVAQSRKHFNGNILFKKV